MAGYDLSTQLILMNPALNPTGFAQHMVTGVEPNAVDSVVAKYLIQKEKANASKSSTKKIPTNLTREERIAWIEKNGGPGLVAKPARNNNFNNFLKQLILSNPVLNPVGWVQHAVLPSQEPTVFDNVMLKPALDSLA